MHQLISSHWMHQVISSHWMHQVIKQSSHQAIRQSSRSEASLQNVPGLRMSCRHGFGCSEALAPAATQVEASPMCMYHTLPRRCVSHSATPMCITLCHAYHSVLSMKPSGVKRPGTDNLRARLAKERSIACFVPARPRRCPLLGTSSTPPRTSPEKHVGPQTWWRQEKPFFQDTCELEQYGKHALQGFNECVVKLRKYAIATRGGDRTYYDCHVFKQVFTGVPVNFKHVFTGVPKISNRVSWE